MNELTKTIIKHSQGSVVASVGKDRWSRKSSRASGKFKFAS